VTAAIVLLCAPGVPLAAEPAAGSVTRRGIRELLERASLLLQALATADAPGLDPERYHLVAIRTRQVSAGGRSATEIEPARRTRRSRSAP
jgi:hypothetical protein